MDPGVREAQRRGGGGGGGGPEGRVGVLPGGTGFRPWGRTVPGLGRSLRLTAPLALNTAPLAKPCPPRVFLLGARQHVLYSGGRGLGLSHPKPALWRFLHSKPRELGLGRGEVGAPFSSSRASVEGTCGSNAAVQDVESQFQLLWGCARTSCKEKGQLSPLA